MKVTRNIAVLVCACGVAASAANDEVRLVGGKDDLAPWREPRGDWFAAASVTTNAADPKLLAAAPGQGSIVNGQTGKTKDLLSQQEFGDVEVHVEFMVPKSSNSGVYLQGRYEVQVFDSWGVAQPKHSDCGGIYQRWANNKGFEGHAPRVNASKAPGEWQSFDITFRAPRFDATGKKIANAAFLKVVHNGQVVHENVELTGPTRAAHYADERATGPLMVQGDHGPVAYRNLMVRPLAAK